MKRNYYSVRTGKLEDNQKIDFTLLKKLFLAIYNKFDEDGYFQKHFGYRCVDSGDVKGDLGSDIEAAIFVHLKKQGLYPIGENLEGYTEADLFDIVEFLHDHISKPIEGIYHKFNNCGWHYKTFDDEQGKINFRENINSIIKDYEGGYEISNQGEILSLPENGLDSLLMATIPTDNETNIKQKVERAILKFRQYRSTWEEQKDAIRELADVLEYLRVEAKEHLTKEHETELFNLANNFGIRHHNSRQKTDYDVKIWYPWMFYYYLSTIHALLRMIEGKKEE